MFEISCVFQHWEVFKVITEVFILVPALVGLKGNLEMTLAARLSTAVRRYFYSLCGQATKIICLTSSYYHLFIAYAHTQRLHHSARAFNDSLSKIRNKLVTSYPGVYILYLACSSKKKCRTDVQLLS